MTVGIDISQIVFSGTGVAALTRSLSTALLKQDHKNRYVLFGASLRQMEQLREFGQKFPDAKKVFLPIPPSILEILWNRLHIIPPEVFCGHLDVFISSDWTDPPTKAKKISPVYDLVVYKYPEFSHDKTEFRADSLAPSANIVATQTRRASLLTKEANLILTISESSRADVEKILGIPQEKVLVIYPAPAREYLDFSTLPTAEKQKQINLVRQKYHLDGNYFLTVGTREPRKNLPRLFTAFREANLAGYSLAVVGKYGWGGDGRRGGQKDGQLIRLLGYVPQADLPALYAGAVGFVFPTLYEGFGIPVIEAQSAGCPVITSNVSSLPEAGGESAWYIDPTNTKDIAQKMQALTELGSSDRQKLVTRGLKHSRLFTWEKAAAEIIGAYEKLV